MRKKTLQAEGGPFWEVSVCFSTLEGILGSGDGQEMEASRG